jgi:GcrA cell cycle regulator
MRSDAWSQESISALRQLWAAGYSTAEISHRMGVSKNSIVGKARRLGLPSRPTPIRRDTDAQIAARRAAFIKMWNDGVERSDIVSALGLTRGRYEHTVAKLVATGAIQARPVGRQRQVNDQPVSDERIARPDTTKLCRKCQKSFLSANGVMHYCNDCKRHSAAWQSGASNIVLAGVRISERP